ncbi:MAG: O-antigen ligase family protein [Candidatus Omnitrophota bacterium]|jgi:O-antigen ligase
MGRRPEIFLEEEKPLIELPALIKIFIAFSALCLGASFLILPWQIVLFLYLGFVLGLIIFFNLYVGILIFLVGAFFHPTYWLTSLQELHPARNLAFAVLFIWAFHTIIYRDFRLVKAPQNLFIALFFAIAFATTFKNFEISFPVWLEIAVKSLVLYFAITNMIRTKGQIVFLIWFIVGISFVSALIGIYQYINHIGVYYAPEGILRISGLAEDANVFAMDLTISLPLAIGLFFCYKKLSIKAIMVGVVGILIVTTILTYSRAGLIQLLSVLFFSIGVRIFRKRKILGILLFVAAIGIFLPLVPSKYLERAQSMFKGGDTAIDVRLTGWKVGLEMIKENPFTGVGFGLFRNAYIMKAVTSSDIQYKLRLDAHNLYIHTAAETGLFGLLLLLFLLFYTFRDFRVAKNNFKEKDDSLFFEISGALEISLLVYLLGGMFISYLQLQIFWIMIPLAVVLRRMSIKQE